MDGTGQVFTVGIMTLLSRRIPGRKTKQQQLTISYNGIDGIIIWEQAVIRGLVMGEDGPKHCLGLGALRFLLSFPTKSGQVGLAGFFPIFFGRKWIYEIYYKPKTTTPYKKYIKKKTSNVLLETVSW